MVAGRIDKNIIRKQHVFTRRAFEAQRAGLQAGEKIARHGDTGRSVQDHPGRRQVVCPPLDLAFADVAVGEIVAGHGDAPAVRSDVQGVFAHNRKGVGAYGASMRIAQRNSAGRIVCNYIGAKRDSVTVAIQHDGGSAALLDHIAGDDRAVGIFDNDAVAEMVVEAVARHAEIEAVDEPEGIVIFLELVRRDDDIVTADYIQPGFLVIRNQRIADSRILVAEVHPDAVAAVIAAGDAVDEKFVNPPGFDAVAALFAAGNAEVG